MMTHTSESSAARLGAAAVPLTVACGVLDDILYILCCESAWLQLQIRHNELKECSANDVSKVRLNGVKEGLEAIRGSARDFGRV